MRKPSVVVAEDDVLIREGCLLPALRADFEVVATVDDGRAAIAAAVEHQPDVVLLDISLPILRGFEAAQQILARQPGSKVLFVSNYSEKAYVDEARRIGASGFVLKSRAAIELVKALRVVLSGGFYT